MHEMSLAAEIVRICADRAAAEGAVRVTEVGIAVGALGHVEPEALAFCLESAARGTCLDGAAFAIDRRPGSAFCPACGAVVEIRARGGDCPACGGPTLRATGSDELNVTHMEIF